MNYYERHLGDYARDAGHLSLLEHGAYTAILDRYYATEAGIPANQVYRVVRALSKQERDAVDTVLSEFFVLTDGVWVNNRCEEEIVKARKKIKAAQENGKRGGRPRATEPEPTENPPGNPLGSDSVTQIKALQTPDTRHQTPRNTEIQARKRATLPAPDGVSPEVWSDWLSLRKAKRAPVTATVVQAAEDEARKAGMGLEAFLRVWCARGSQGLEAAWLKPAERGSTEPAWQQEKRDRMAQFAGPAAAKPKPDLEVIDGTACILDRRVVR